MSSLIESMKIVLATTFSFYLKAHYFHWNVEGQYFIELHDFFGKLYEETWNDVDTIAEHIRALDGYAPGSLSRFSQLSKIVDEITVSHSMEMVAMLRSDNKILIATMRNALELAKNEKQEGIQNFLQDRIDNREKLDWMLRSIVKR